VFCRYKILAISSGIDDFGIIRWEMLACSVVFRIILFLCVIKSIQAIGKVRVMSVLYLLCLTVSRINEHKS